MQERENIGSLHAVKANLSLLLKPAVEGMTPRDGDGGSLLKSGDLK